MSTIREIHTGYHARTVASLREELRPYQPASSARTRPRNKDELVLWLMYYVHGISFDQAKQALNP